MTPFLVVVGCPSDPWLVQAFTATGGLVWLGVLCVLLVIACERAQDWARRSREE